MPKKLSISWILSVGVAFLMACQQPAPSQPEGVSTGPDSTGSVVQPPAFKVGYVNSAELLSLMPELKEAEGKLERYARNKENRFNNLAQSYQNRLQELQQKGATMLPSEQEAAVKELTGMEQQLQQMQASSQQEIAMEKERLYQPILARADSVIKQLGKDGQYTFIYDGPGLLYADTTLNLLPEIARRMGLPYKGSTQADSISVPVPDAN